ncbi:hypothetical protein BESB_076640 [Besnoitia besnoiti]|uniref:Uncharacterized protein n=1 Tax=Besnoitia besnoiti TaxID=94643 RepID=A0A2A9MCX4_BESBE|nr:hypothetical protein BESB_076640 [Besnoitia besnoiti]PFH33447.1 hypothetical protein BESB_076640 [Besnoitia besnoiti]
MTDLYARFGAEAVESVPSAASSQARDILKRISKLSTPSAASSRATSRARPPYPFRWGAAEMKNASSPRGEEAACEQDEDGTHGFTPRAARERSHRYSLRCLSRFCAVKTFVDLSSYSIEKVDIGQTSAEPGPLLLLYLFYSRLHEHLLQSDASTPQSSESVSSLFARPYSLTEGNLTIRDAKKMSVDLLLHQPPFSLSVRHVEKVWASVAPRHPHLNNDPFLAALNAGEFIAFFAGLAVLAASRVAKPGVTSYFDKLRMFMRRFACVGEIKCHLLDAYRDRHIPALAKYPLQTRTELPARELLLALPQGQVRTLPAVKPDPAAYRWLLENFVFCRPKPVWHAFRGIFLDMGVQRHSPPTASPPAHADALGFNTGSAFTARQRHRFCVQIRNLTFSPMAVRMQLLGLAPVTVTMKPNTVVPPKQSVRLVVTADCRHAPGEWYGQLRLHLTGGKGRRQRVAIPVYVSIADESRLTSGATTPLPLYSAWETITSLGARGGRVAFRSLPPVKQRLPSSSRASPDQAASETPRMAPSETEIPAYPQPARQRSGDGVSQAFPCGGEEAHSARPPSASRESVKRLHENADAMQTTSSTDIGNASEVPGGRPIGAAQSISPARRSFVQRLTMRERVSLEREMHLHLLRAALPKAARQPPAALVSESDPNIIGKAPLGADAWRQRTLTPKQVTRAKTPNTRTGRSRQPNPQISKSAERNISDSEDGSNTSSSSSSSPPAAADPSSPAPRLEPAARYPNLSSAQRDSPRQGLPQLQSPPRQPPPTVHATPRARLRKPVPLEATAEQPGTVSSRSEPAACLRSHRFCRPPHGGATAEASKAGSLGGECPSVEARRVADCSKPRLSVGVAPGFVAKTPQAAEQERLAAFGTRGRKSPPDGLNNEIRHRTEETLRCVSTLAGSGHAFGLRRHLTLSPRNTSLQHQGMTLMRQCRQGSVVGASEPSTRMASARSAPVSGETFSRTVFAAAEKRLEELRLSGSIYAATG